MKKYIFGAVFAFVILVSPASSYAAGLTSTQINAILTLLSAFNADATTIANVSAALNGTSNANTTTTNSSVLSLSVSNSTSGPWAINGSLPNSGTIYVQTTGLIKANAPKGCMSPAGSTGCLNTGAYRDFTPSEWVNNSTVRTVVYGGQFPNGSYDAYILYPNGQPTKVGTVGLGASTTTPPPTGSACFVTGAGQTCSYKWSCSAFGAGVQPPSTACSASNVNTSVNVTNGTCTCSYTMDTTTTPAPQSTIQVSLSNSTSGPWAINGSLPNSGTIYVQTTGLIKANAPKGCMSPAGATGCLSASAYRDFTAAEWVNNTTVRTVVTGGQFPNGSYDGYILYPNGQPIKVGTVSLGASVGGTVNAAPGYSWEVDMGQGSILLTSAYGKSDPSLRCDSSSYGIQLSLGPSSNVADVVATCMKPGDRIDVFGRVVSIDGTITLVRKLLSLSNSTSGPWRFNGSLSNSGTIYVQTTGLIKANAPKGCMSPAGATGCLSASAYRDFTAAEWVNNTTVRTVVTGGQFPNGSYDGYILYPNGQPIKVGTVTLTAPTTTTPPSPTPAGPACFVTGAGQTCSYKWSCSAFGAGVQPPSTACSASNINTSVNVTNGTCTCSYTMDTTTTSTATTITSPYVVGPGNGTNNSVWYTWSVYVTAGPMSTWMSAKDLGFAEPSTACTAANVGATYYLGVAHGQGAAIEGKNMVAGCYSSAQTGNPMIPSLSSTTLNNPGPATSSSGTTSTTSTTSTTNTTTTSTSAATTATTATATPACTPANGTYTDSATNQLVAWIFTCGAPAPDSSWSPQPNSYYHKVIGYGYDTATQNP